MISRKVSKVPPPSRLRPVRWTRDMRLERWQIAMGLGLLSGGALMTSLKPGLLVNVLIVGGAATVLVVLRRRLAPPLMSPVVLVTVGLIAVAALGAIFYSDVQYVTDGASAVVVLDDDETKRTFELIMICAYSLLTGAAAVCLLAPRLPVVAAPRHLTLSGNLKVLIMLGCLVPIVIILSGNGASDLWHRSDYITEAMFENQLRGLASQLALGAVLVLGYLARSSRGRLRVIALTGATTYLLIFFGGATRSLALWPLLLMLGWYLANRSRRALALLGVAAVLALYAIRLPLYLRGLPMHGIEPYWAHLEGFADFNGSWGSVYRNLLISFGIIGATAFQQDPLSAHVLAVSLNPLPGTWIGWYDVAPALRINTYTPFAGVGELGNHGILVAVLYFLTAGMILALFDRQIIRLLASNRQVLGLALIGLSVLFLLYSVQYNLRSSTRMLLYGLLVYMFLGLFFSLHSTKEVFASCRLPKSLAPSAIVPGASTSIRSGSNRRPTP